MALQKWKAWQAARAAAISKKVAPTSKSSSSSVWSSKSSGSSGGWSYTPPSIAQTTQKAIAAGKTPAQIAAAAWAAQKATVWSSGGSSSSQLTQQQIASIQNTIAKAQAAGKSNAEINSALQYAMANWVSIPKPTNQIAPSSNTAVQQWMTAAEYAAKFPGAPNPYANDATSDIAMIWNKWVSTKDLSVDWNAIKTTWELDVWEPTLPTTDVDNSFTQYQSDVNTQIRDNTLNELDKTRAQQESVIKWLEMSNNEITREKAAIRANRFANADQTFAQINERMAKLEEAAKNVFDQGAARAAIAQAKQMAEQWFITNEQVSAVANFAVADYRRAADLQRAELEQEIQTQYMDILKEKQNIIDWIMADQSMDLSTKQQYASQIAWMYNDLSNNMMNAYTGIQNQFGQSQWAITSPYIWVEAWAQQAITGKEIENQIQDMDVNRALRWWALEKTNFILDFVNNKVNSNLSPYIMEILRSKYNDPAFNSWTMSKEQFQNLLADIVSQANKKYAAANASPAVPNPFAWLNLWGNSQQPQWSGWNTPFIDTSIVTGNSMPFNA